MNRTRWGMVNQSALGAGYGDEIVNGYTLQAGELVLSETGGSLLTDASEQILYVRDAPMSVFDPRCVMIGLDDMVALDNLQVRVYYRLADAGAWHLYDYAQYTGADGGLADGKKMIAIELLPCRHGVQVTVQMTVGTATLPWCAVEEV